MIGRLVGNGVGVVGNIVTVVDEADQLRFRVYITAWAVSLQTGIYPKGKLQLAMVMIWWDSIRWRLDWLLVPCKSNVCPGLSRMCK